MSSFLTITRIRTIFNKKMLKALNMAFTIRSIQKEKFTGNPSCP